MTERANRLEIEFEEIKRKLKERKIIENNTGSIAEAALKLNGVFEAAQNAADIYLNAAKERAAEIENEAARRAETILEEARKKAEHCGQDI